jgi:GNAT superfamily N-acetyltransferase
VTPFRIVPLSDQNRSGVSCGVEALDRYFQTQASQDVRRLVAKCFVALAEGEQIAGYYTLSALSVAREAFGDERASKLPRYKDIPCALVGRLAIDLAFQGRKLGAALIGDAVRRCQSSDVAINMLVVDAKDSSAAAFYRRIGFTPLGDQPLRLFVPLKHPPATP